jgi:hypothetical protein
VRQVAKFFVQAAHDNIWKPRCEAQVQWEQELGITRREKLQVRERCRQDRYRVQRASRVTHVTQVLAGQCPECQLSLAIHQVDRCPPMIIQAPVLADRLLQSHYHSLTIAPSIINPCSTIKALDSSDKAAGV